MWQTKVVSHVAYFLIALNMVCAGVLLAAGHWSGFFNALAGLAIAKTITTFPLS